MKLQLDEINYQKIKNEIPGLQVSTTDKIKKLGKWYITSWHVSASNKNVEGSRNSAKSH